MAGFLCFPVSMVPHLGLLMHLRVLVTWLRVPLVGILQVWLLSGVPLVSLMVLGLGLLLLCRITPMSGRMVALFLIGLLVYLLQVLGSLLTSLGNAGVVVGGVMLTVFVQIMMLRLVGASVVFLGFSNRCRGLRCGVSFWLLMRFTWVLIILGGSACWSVA